MKEDTPDSRRGRACACQVVVMETERVGRWRTGERGWRSSGGVEGIRSVCLVMPFGEGNWGAGAEVCFGLRVGEWSRRSDIVCRKCGHAGVVGRGDGRRRGLRRYVLWERRGSP